jgi:cytochrome c oxidase assembly factor CtaG
LFFIWIAIASPLMALDHELLTAHMVQHLLLMTLAPPLIWLGEPVKALLYGLPQQIVQAVINPLCSSPQARQMGNALAHPAVCWFGAAATLVGWHIPAVFMLGLQSGTWHAIEQVSFLATGLLFWWPVVQPWPMASKLPEWLILLYLFLATLPCDILSGFLVFCDRVVYPIYLSSSHPFGLSTLEDQQCAGAFMWTCVTVVYLLAGTILAAHLLSPNTSRHHEIARADSQPSVTRVAPQTTRQGLEVA